MDLTIHNAILDTTGLPIHVGILDGKIEILSDQPLPPGRQAIDAKGAMVSPALKPDLPWTRSAARQPGPM